MAKGAGGPVVRQAVAVASTLACALLAVWVFQNAHHVDAMFCGALIGFLLFELAQTPPASSACGRLSSFYRTWPTAPYRLLRTLGAILLLVACLFAEWNVRALRSIATSEIRGCEISTELGERRSFTEPADLRRVSESLSKARTLQNLHRPLVTRFSIVISTADGSREYSYRGEIVGATADEAADAAIVLHVGLHEQIIVLPSLREFMEAR